MPNKPITPQQKTKKLYITKDEGKYINWIGDPENPHTTRDMGIIKKWANFEESIRVDEFGAYVEVTPNPITPQPTEKLEEEIKVKWHSLTCDLIKEMSKGGLQKNIPELNQYFSQWEEKCLNMFSQELSKQREEMERKIMELDKNVRKFKAPNQVKNKNSWETGKYAATNYLTNELLKSLTTNKGTK